MSEVSYISFPKKPKSTSLSDIMGINGLNDSYNVLISDKGEATFNDCLKNSFIYELYIGPLSNDYVDDCLEISQENLDHLTVMKKLKKRADRSQRLYQQGLHDFLYMNLTVGEFAEVYTGWTNHINYDFCQPESRHIINLGDLLNTPLPTKMQHTESHVLTINKINEECGVYALQGSTTQDYDDSEMFYKRRLAHLKTQGDESGVANACMELGNITELYQDTDAAETWYKQALGIWVKLGDYRKAAHTCSKLARLSFEEGIQKRLQAANECKLDAFAVGWFEQALDYAMKAGDDYYAADAYTGLANRAVLRKDFSAAEHFYIKSLSHKLTMYGEKAKCDVYFNLAYVADEQGEYDAAVNYYKKVLNNYLTMGDKYCHHAGFIYSQLRKLAIKYEKS